ncbi:hypothetical protein Tco_0608788 [Tanacetum coccineum]
MEEDYEPTVQHQRWVNPKIHDVIKKEVEKLLDAGLIYPISDSLWIPIDPKDQERQPFTCPYGTLLTPHAFRAMQCTLERSNDLMANLTTTPIGPKRGEKPFYGEGRHCSWDTKSQVGNVRIDRAKLTLSPAPSPDTV